MPAEDFDIIIAGGGCSGLSLAWQLMQHENLGDLRVLLIEPDRDQLNERTWCFWDDEAIPAPVPIRNSWPRLEVRFEEFRKSEVIHPFRYHCVTGADYAAAMHSALDDIKNISRITDRVESYDHQEDHVIINTEKGIFRADRFFKSYGTPDTTNSRVPLLQHFLGWEISTESDFFDPQTALFMDFTVPQTQKGGVAFVYVLPFSGRNALVEYTLFSPKILGKGEYEQEIRNYLSKNFPTNDFKIERQESGVIPMADHIFNPGESERVIYLGTASGIPKASTGYAFSRIHRQTKELAQQLADGIAPVPQNPSEFRYRVYDLLLLDIIRHQTPEAVGVFKTLFQNNSIPDMLRFLDEKTAFDQDLRIMYSAPWAPFFKAIFKQLIIKSRKTD